MRAFCRSKIALFVLAATSALHAQGPTITVVPPVPHHEANFEREQKEANDLFLANKVLESLPLYEDLCRQDPTVALFAERHAQALFFKAGSSRDTQESTALSVKAYAELRRAQSLGSNSSYLRATLAAAAKTPIGAVLSGVPLTSGWSYRGSPEAQRKLNDAEEMFAKQDYKGAAALYQEAAALDPRWYEPPLYAGDMYYRMRDWSIAGLWFQKAVDLDPDRDTAYRYWGDAAYHAGRIGEAKYRYEQAIVAQPYDETGWQKLQEWATVTRIAMCQPQIKRPEFTAPLGKLKVDPALTVETGDGHASWLVYQNARVAHGATELGQWIVPGSFDINGHIKPSGYRHTLAEEVESIDLLLADVQKKLDSGIVTSEKLEPSLKALMALKKDGLLESWILLSASDAGIRYDYPDYRKGHRDLLVSYIEHHVLVLPPPAVTRSNQKAAALVAEAVSLERSQDWDAVLKKLDEAKALEPEQPFLWSNYGYVAMMQRRPQEAKSHFQHELQLHPEESFVVQLYARFLQGFGEDAEARKVLSQSFNKYPYQGEIGLMLAVLQGRDNPADAVSTLRRAAEASPLDHRVQFTLAEYLIRAQQPGEAASLARKRLEAAGEDPELLKSFSYVLAETGTELDLAEQSARKALQILEDRTSNSSIREANMRSAENIRSLLGVWHTLGLILFKQQKLEQSIDYLEASWLNGGNRAVGDHYARVKEALGDSRAALRVYELARNEHENDEAGATAHIESSIARLKKAGLVSTVSGNAAQILQEQRTYRIKLKAAPSRYSSANFRLTLGAGGEVLEVMRVSGDPFLETAASSLQEQRLGHLLPTQSRAHLQRDGVLSCSAGQSTCLFVLLPLASGGPIW